MKMFHIIVCSILMFLFVNATNDTNSCGKSLGTDYRNEQNRIIGGYDVGYYRYPWYASLINKNTSVCGGTLIAARTVLTAAHCYKNYLKQNRNDQIKLETIFNVRLGMYNNCIEEKDRKDFKVEKVNIHELYMTKKPFYDIALLTLQGNTDKYTPICLPSPGTILKPKEGTVVGMGYITTNGSIPCTLHEARMLIYPNTECNKIVEATGNNKSSVVNTFCAGYSGQNTDVCGGDSGDPFQVINNKGEQVLLGLVSFGFHCSSVKSPGLYTDVSKYLNWIDKKSGLFIQDVLKPSKPSSSNAASPFKKIITIIVNGHKKIFVLKH